MVYETLEADGEPLRSGRVLSAEFHNNGKTHQAMWFQDPGTSKGTYYTLDGESMRRAYLTSPVEFSRVSSSFKMRFHPILQKWRAHLGTDYAAPTGTTVRTDKASASPSRPFVSWGSSSHSRLPPRST